MGTAFDDQVVFRGLVIFGSGAEVALPDDVVGDDQVAPGADIDAGKLNHAHRAGLRQASGSAATATTQQIHTAFGAGVIKGVKVSPIVAATGDSTVTIDVKKNGVTILAGTISLTSATAAYAKVVGTLAVTTYAAGDVFTVVQTVSAGTGTLPQGVSTSVDLWEAPE